MESVREFSISSDHLADIEEAARRPLAAFGALDSAISAIETFGASNSLVPELKDILRELRHRAAYLAADRPWRGRALRHVQNLLRGAREVARGDRSAMRAAFLLKYLMLRIHLRQPGAALSKAEAREIVRFARRVHQAWLLGARRRRLLGIGREDCRLADEACRFTGVPFASRGIPTRTSARG